jgi:hypothetical protein
VKYLFLLFLLSCSATSNKPLTKEELSTKSQEKLAENSSKLRDCSKFLDFKNTNMYEVQMSFRITPGGRLETLWLNDTVKWPDPFYHCLYNTIDHINFPSNEDGISLEIEQPLVFKKP